MAKIKRSIVAGMFTLASFFIGNMAHAGIDNKAATVPWGYSGTIGPAQWGKLNADFQLCSMGNYQTPIDIGHAVSSDKRNLHIVYRVSPLRIMKDGVTSLIVGQQQLKIKEGHTIQVDFPKNTQEKVIIAKIPYRLVQFHFHTPSETLLQGHQFPLEIHFVNQGPQGKLAVIGVFVETGKENPALNPILSHIPKVKGKEYKFSHVNINPTALLPKNQSHYIFMGSLTTPPCAEGVKWFVMQHPIQASAAQIAKIKQAQGGNNARPLQPLHDRQVQLWQE